MYRNAYRNNVSDVLLGILLASVVGVIVATFFIMTRENRPTSVETTSPELIQPNVSQPQSVQRETTVIERTVDRVREVIPTTPQSVEIVVPSTPASPAPSPVISDQPTSQQVNEQTESQTGAIDEVPLPNTSSPDAMAQ
jgi:cytoskeletal protein RodZ